MALNRIELDDDKVIDVTKIVAMAPAEDGGYWVHYMVGDFGGRMKVSATEAGQIRQRMIDAGVAGRN
jgi:hypothetical protein